MLPKINRLTKNKEFDNVFKRGRSSFDKITGVKFVANNLGINRIGILVSFKVSKKAVERNKIKRRIREIVRAELKNLKNGLDIVIIALPDIKNKTFKEIKPSLAGHFKKLRLNE